MEGVIFGRVSNVDNFRREVCNDVISGKFVNPTGVKVHGKVGDSRSNRSRDIQLPHFVTNNHDDDNDPGHHVRAKRHKAFCIKKKISLKKCNDKIAE